MNTLIDVLQSSDTGALPADSCSGKVVADQASVHAWGDLGAECRDVWERIRATSPDYRTPFYSTVFCDAVQAARGDVMVAVIRQGRTPIGFLPFHRIGRAGEPVGRCFNDAHNVIARDNVQFDWLWLLSQCGLRAFHFHALTGRRQEVADCYAWGQIESFSAVLGNNSSAFLSGLEKDHKTIRRQEQKSRKMAREVGPLRLDWDCRNRQLLEQAIEWKRQQYRRTHILDHFTPRWTRDLVRQLHRAPADGARGILSVLYAGRRVVAAHFGMIEGGLLHYWFPAYDVRFARYSPGTALFKAIVRVATDHGIDCVDMGYGQQPYKRKQTDTVTTVSCGSITASPVDWQWRRASHVTRKLLKQMPMKERLKRALRRLHPEAGIGKLT